MNVLDTFKLENRRALVTGAGQGLGLAMATGLAEAGAEVILNDIDTDRLAAAATALRDCGHTVHEAAFDVTSPNGVVAVVDNFEKNTGPVDILVNNAGTHFRGSLENMPTDRFEKLMGLNVNAAYYLGRAVASHMISRSKGKIVNICSVQTRLARPNIAAYTASKGAIANLTKGMAADWAHHGMQINGLAPGYMKTEMTAKLVADPEFSAWIRRRTPAGRWGELEDLMGACVFLCSDAANFVNGHILYVDGGMTVTV